MGRWVGRSIGGSVHLFVHPSVGCFTFLRFSLTFYLAASIFLVCLANILTTKFLFARIRARLRAFETKVAGAGTKMSPMLLIRKGGGSDMCLDIADGYVTVIVKSLSLYNYY